MVGPVLVRGQSSNSIHGTPHPYTLSLVQRTNPLPASLLLRTAPGPAFFGNMRIFDTMRANSKRVLEGLETILLLQCACSQGPVLAPAGPKKWLGLFQF
jgi:hypothetical protein